MYLGRDVEISVLYFISHSVNAQTGKSKFKLVGIDGHIT